MLVASAQSKFRAPQKVSYGSLVQVAHLIVPEMISKLKVDSLPAINIQLSIYTNEKADTSIIQWALLDKNNMQLSKGTFVKTGKDVITCEAPFQCYFDAIAEWLGVTLKD